jgi:hypothetical protein
MTQVVEYNITDAAISKMSDQYMGLFINGIDDKEGFDKVHEARMVVKNHRVAVHKREQEYKDQLNAKKKEVVGEAKRIYALLEPIETHLQTEENKVIQEKERKKREKIEAEQKRVDSIRNAISEIEACGIVDPRETSASIRFIITTVVEDMPVDESTYMEFTEEAERIKATTIQRLNAALDARLQWEKEEAGRKAETERLEKIRAEQEVKEKELEEKRKADEEKARKEREAIEEEKQKIQEEKDRIAREKLAEQEAKEKAEREAQEKAEREKKDVQEKARQEALKPDKEKVADFLASVKNYNVPELENPEMIEFINHAMERISSLVDLISKDLEEL